MGDVIPREEVRRRSRAWEARPLDTPGWRILETPKGVLRGDVDEDLLRAIGVYLEEFNRALRAAVAGPAPRARFTARVFAERRDFCLLAACAGAPNAESLYDPRTGEIAVWFDGQLVPDWQERIFGHEFTHAYMDLVWARTGPLWFAEGMAEYFSNAAWDGERLVPGQVNAGAVELLRRTPRIPLPRLLRLPRGEIYGPEYAVIYAHAWSFVHYLFAREPEQITGLLDGRSPVDVGALGIGWSAYLEELMRGTR
jgi:hypothetical protein